MRDVARITHHNDEAYVGALAVVTAIRVAAMGELPSPQSIAAHLPDSRVRDYLLRTAAYGEATLPEIARAIGTSGFAPETVAVAVTLVRQMLRDGIETAIHELNEVGGDTDTIGSIAGQIAGTFVGVDGLPLHVIEHVPDADTVMRVAEQFGVAAHRRLTSR